MWFTALLPWYLISLQRQRRTKIHQSLCASPSRALVFSQTTTKTEPSLTTKSINNIHKICKHSRGFFHMYFYYEFNLDRIFTKTDLLHAGVEACGRERVREKKSLSAAFNRYKVSWTYWQYRCYYGDKTLCAWWDRVCIHRITWSVRTYVST